MPIKTTDVAIPVFGITTIISWLRDTAFGPPQPFVPGLADRELSTVLSYPYADETCPWQPGSKLRLILTADSVLFVERSFLTPGIVLLQIRRADLLAVEVAHVPMADNSTSLGAYLFDSLLYGRVEARQIMRHYELVLAVAGPRRVPALAIQYHDKSKYDGKQLVVAIEPPGGPGMPLKETAYHLRKIIDSYRRSLGGR